MPELPRLVERTVHRGGRDEEEFAGRGEELRRYLERSSGRFAETLELVERLALVGPVLELGADPWLFTQLLLERGIDVVSAGQRGGPWSNDPAGEPPEQLRLRWGDRDHVLDHHLFDAERDRWPFADGAFATVLCTEVVEHLVFSPAHLLYEANRVLGPGGVLVLTTPNAVSATKLARMARGRNVHGPYSGYGAHGRHNREFTAGEVRALLEAAGFAARIETANVAGYEADEPLGRALRALAGRVWPSRRDHVLAVGRKSGPPRFAFVEGLYRSVDRERMRAEGVRFPDE